MRVILAFIASVISAVLIGAAVLSWFDQAGYLAANGAMLTTGERFGWYVDSLKGLVLDVGLYPILMAVGLLVAFVVAAIVKRLAPGLRFWWYAGAGAVAIVTVVLALKGVMGLFVIPGARTVAGIAAQGVVGFIAGGLFAILSRTPERRGLFT
jgi:hypothetical protein